MYYYTGRLTDKSDVFSFVVFSLSDCSPERNHPSATPTAVTVLFHTLSRYSQKVTWLIYEIHKSWKREMVKSKK